MTHARIPDFSVPLPARPITIREFPPIPCDRMAMSGANLTAAAEPSAPPRAPARFAHAVAQIGDVIAAGLLIGGGVVLIGLATLL